MYSAAKRIQEYSVQGKDTIILHFGDHDPFGIDMTRDNQERLSLFGSEAEVRRIGLNMIQISEFNPPPNPTKFTDSRSSDYSYKFGNSSWELDALTPDQLNSLINTQIKVMIKNLPLYLRHYYTKK